MIKKRVYLRRNQLVVLALASFMLPMQAVVAEETDFAMALQTTLSQHPTLTGQYAEVEAKDFAGDSARAQRYPSISGQVSAQHTDTYPIGIRARQPLWAFGRIDSGIAYADTDMSVQEIALLQLKRQLIDETAVAYASIQGGRERLSVALENVTALESMYQQIDRRAQGQLASLADVRLAKARLLQAQAQKERIASELQVAQNELLALTQTPVMTVAPVPETVTDLPNVLELMTLALDSSADIRLKTENIALAKADVDRERAAPMPTVYLQADYFYNDQAAGTSDFRVGVNIEANLEGMGFVAFGRNNAADARLRSVNADLDASRNEVKRNINSLYTNRVAQKTIMASHRYSVAELSEILLSYQRQYEAGQKPWLDVLNMQRELTEQKYQLSQAHNEWLIYSLKLAAFVGTLDTLAGEKTLSDEQNVAQE
ncbi:MAG: TolC family protein [Methylococcaceae bacterium]|nr:TolC family protein [Methylococcaceae bacterium]